MSRQHPFPGVRYLAGLLALALFFVLPGCDSAGSSGDETLVLSDPANPTVATFDFLYDEGNFNDGMIAVTSEEEDQLSGVLDAYGGYSRSDIVSVRVEEVRMERRSVAGTAANQVPKVFEYLTRAEVYMGDSTSEPLIGSAQPVPFDAEITLGLEERDVTSQVKSGPTKARLQLFLEDASEIGSGGDHVEVDVEFRIEVRE